VEPLIRPPIAFAHRGARAHAPDNTIEAFQLALRLGATGLESDVWLTSDGTPVLDHDGVVRVGRRKRRIGDVTASDIPSEVPTLAALYESCGTGFDLSLDIKDPAAARPVVSVVRAAGHALERVWLCYEASDVLAEWRSLGDVRLVQSTRLRRMKGGPERRAADLASAGIDAVNLHASDWSGGLTTLFHRFELFAFGWDAQHDRILAALLRMGIDAVYSDHVDRMVEAVKLSQR
jgi:glycerophosphoryl diester phosphodiesterase